jgi:uncharacterized protein (TIGR03086 family)
MDVAMLERAVEDTRKIVAGTSEDQMDAPTPCTEWSVRDLLDHMIGGNEAVGGAADLPASDHVARYDASARKMIDAFSAPGALEKTFEMPWGDTPGPVLLGLMIADTVVHGTDLARATGQDVSVDPELAEAVYGMTSEMMEPNGSFPRGTAFAPPVEVPADAPVQDKMLAYLGRRP